MSTVPEFSAGSNDSVLLARFAYITRARRYTADVDGFNKNFLATRYFERLARHVSR